MRPKDAPANYTAAFCKSPVGSHKLSETDQRDIWLVRIMRYSADCELQIFIPTASTRLTHPPLKALPATETLDQLDITEPRRPSATHLRHLSMRHLTG